MLDARNFFDLTKSIAGEKLSAFSEIWQAVPEISKIINELSNTLDNSQFIKIKEGVYVHESAEIDETAYIGAPCIVDAGAKIRRCAFIRGSAIIGKNAVVGNSTEIKNAILFDGVQVPHFNYAGDSILGYCAHLGAGAILSNVKADKSYISVRAGGETLKTPLKKLGAIVGDFAEIGCNSVIAPGAVIGRNSVVYPLSFIRGEVSADTIFKPCGLITKNKCSNAQSNT